MDASTVMAAYNGLKFAKDTLSTLVEGKIQAESQGKVLEALSKLAAAQDTLFQLRDELFTLQSENHDLKTEVARSNTWRDRLASYELFKATGGAIVYRYTGQPEHFACPSCVNAQKIEILQDKRGMSGLFRCTGCDKEFPIEIKKPQPPLNFPRRPEF